MRPCGYSYESGIGYLGRAVTPIALMQGIHHSLLDDVHGLQENIHRGRLYAAHPKPENQGGNIQTTTKRFAAADNIGGLDQGSSMYSARASIHRSNPAYARNLSRH